MKFFLFILCSLFFTGTTFALRLKRVMPDPPLSKGKEQVFEFIFKLDSLNYHSGKVRLKFKLVNRFNNCKREKVQARYKQLSDSVYSVRIKGDTYLLNTQNGQVIDSKKGWVVYRNPRFRFYKYEQTATRGTDEFGSFTAYFVGFHADKTIPSDIVYDPQFITPNQSVQYSITCTPIVNDSDSTWIQNDTLKVIKEYGTNGQPISERRVRSRSFAAPEIIEFHYSWSGDTLITNLTLFDDGLHEEHPEEFYMTKSPFKLRKQVTLSDDHTTYSYEYTEGENGTSVQTDNKSWKFGERDGFYFNETHKQVFLNGEERFKLNSETRIHFSGKK